MATVYRILFTAILLSSLLHFTSQDQHSNHLLLTQLQEAKLKIAQFESSLEEINQKVKARDLYLEEREKQIQEMEKRVNSLQSIISNLKSGFFTIDEKIDALEEEVKTLWAISRKSNFDIHILQSKAREAEERLETVILQVEKMEDIVSERWIQIQQFEQALQLREMTVVKVRRQARHSRCSFLKLMEDLSSKYLGPLDSYLFDRDSTFRSLMSQIVNQLNRFYSRVKESHHKLQGFIKREMERHEFTAHLSNEELVFVMASVVVIFPVLSAWMLL